MTAVAPELATKVRDFISTDRPMLIGGEWVTAASGETFETIDPANGRTLTSVARGDATDIDRAVRAARKAFDDGPWSRMKPNERERLLWRVGDILNERAEEFGQLEALDNGKAATIATAVDTAWSADIFRYNAGLATKITGSTVDVSMPFVPGGEFHAYTLREPVGVCGLIVPWNFPLLMASFKLAPALAAGNTVILKPAEQTPLTALLLGEVFTEAGFPPGVVNIVTGFGDAGAALAAHDDVDKIAFTGSTEVGKKIVEASKGNLKKVSLELGGKSPNIVFADADFEQAVAGSVAAWMFNHGQCCVAGTRLFVERPIFDDFTAAVAEAASKAKIGPGLDPTTELGPLVSQEQFDRVSGYLAAGLADGARALTGGKRWGDEGSSSSRQCSSTSSPTSPSFVRRSSVPSSRRCRSTPTRESLRQPMIRSTGSPRASGPPTCRRRTRPLVRSRRVRCGSTSTTASTPRCPSAAISNRAGDASWASRPSSSTPRPRPSTSRSDSTL